MAAAYPGHAGIFGTPTEPLFNVKPMGMSASLLEEWLVVLAGENTTSMGVATCKQGYFKQGEYAEFFFLTCKNLKLPAEARYLAVELFDKFMMRHLHELHDHVQKLEAGDKTGEWMAVVAQVQNQVLLRAVSCCQLASKLTTHYKVVTGKKARSVLATFGQRYSQDNVLQSELRILKTLDYRVMLVSPLLYLETILEILGHNDTSIDVKSYYGVCLDVLDIVYIQRADVYGQLYHIATGRSVLSDKDRVKFAKVENDYMLLAVAIVAATSYIIDQAFTHRVIKNLSQITRIPNDDILDFATVLVQTILQGSEP